MFNVHETKARIVEASQEKTVISKYLLNEEQYVGHYSKLSLAEDIAKCWLRSCLR